MNRSSFFYFILILKRAITSCGALLWLSIPAIGQNQAVADSLESLYTSGNFHYKDQLKILEGLMINHPNPDKVLFYSDALLEIAEAMDSTQYYYRVDLEKGNAYRLKGDLTQALNYYFKASQFATDYGQEEKNGTIYTAIADVYSIMGNHESSLEYYRSAIEILRRENDSLIMATALLNLGDEYFNYGELDSALLYFQQSGEIFRALDYAPGVAYNLGNVGLAYAQKGNYERAERDIESAIDMLTELGDYYPICVYLTYMSDIYMTRQNQYRAIDYAKQSLELAKKYGLKDQISDACLQLSKIYEALDQPRESFKFYREHIVYRDSVASIKAVQEMADLRTDYEVAQKQSEVDLLIKEGEIAELQAKRQKLIIYGVLLLLALTGFLGIGTYQRFRFVKKTNRIIEQEKNRSENLLLNILPRATAEELKKDGKVKARRIDSTTVLFTDFVEFSMHSKRVEPEQLVQSIDYYFSKFDEITTRHGLEKIKTIGDSYMCVGGMYDERSNQTMEVVLAAKEMIDIVHHSRKRKDTLIPFDIRVGIHTGPVVAGIVGTKKWQFDIWGDTVNIASRMESNSTPGKINISETTYHEIQDEFNCQYRGEIEVKNRGSLKMYYIS